MIDVQMELKSDEMIDFLEMYDLQVVYDFDRLHEGQEDRYSVHCETLSLELLFDASQRCTTIFIRDPQAAFDSRLVAFPQLRTLAEVEAYASEHALEIHRGPSWIRCDGPERCLHYEFRKGKLKMLTIMASNAAPGFGESC